MDTKLFYRRILDPVVYMLKEFGGYGWTCIALRSSTDPSKLQAL